MGVPFRLNFAFGGPFWGSFGPGVHQNSDLWLLLATFVITTCYADLKPRVRILAAAGNLRPQDPKITPKKDPKTAPRAQRNPKKDPQRQN